MISNCETPTEKASECLDFHLKFFMQRRKLYVKETEIILLAKLKAFRKSEISVTADVVGIYSSI